jgi:predicted nucleotidyltransferase
MRMETTLLERLCAAAAVVFRGTSILAAYAYGSRVSGRPRPESDVDIGYYLQGYQRGQLLSLGEESRLASALVDVVGIPVDLRNLAEAPLELRGRVLEEGVRIYSGDDPERVALERYVLAHYHDYKETFRAMHENRLRNLARRGL